MDTNKPKWYDNQTSNSDNNELVENIKHDMCKCSKYIHETTHDSLDTNIKKFILQCDEQIKIIDRITKLQDKPRTNSELYEFKREVLDIRNNLIIEAYKRELLTWKD